MAKKRNIRDAGLVWTRSRFSAAETKTALRSLQERVLVPAADPAPPLPGRLVSWLVPVSVMLADAVFLRVRAGGSTDWGFLTAAATLIVLVLLGVLGSRRIRVPDLERERRWVLGSLLATSYVACASYLAGIHTGFGKPLGLWAASAPLVFWFLVSTVGGGFFGGEYRHVKEPGEWMGDLQVLDLSNPWGRFAALVYIPLGAAFLAFLIVAPNPD